MISQLFGLMTLYSPRYTFILIVALFLVTFSTRCTDANGVLTNANKTHESAQTNPVEYKKYRIALRSLVVLDTHSGTYPAHWYLKFGGSYTGLNGIVNTKYDETQIWDWPKGSQFSLYNPINLTGSVYVDLNIPKNTAGIVVSSEGVAVDTGDIILTQDHVLGKVQNYYPKELNYGAGSVYGYTSSKGDYQLIYQIFDLSQRTILQAPH